MCSAEEAYDRQRFHEISHFECSDSSLNVHPKERVPDPCRCVKKYRRSAAGGGVDGYENNYDGHNIISKGRSVECLEITVNYLLGIIFSTQRSSSVSSSHDETTNSRQSLLQSVLFVDDRIRAVQVDLTTLMGHADTDVDTCVGKIQSMQMKIIRYHILSQHLLSNLSSKQYEWKFASKALTTAISAYFATWDLQNQSLESQKDYTILDEVMCYVTLLHVAYIVNSREPSIGSYNSTISMQKWCGLTCEDGHGMSAVLGLYRRYCLLKSTADDSMISLFPKYMWALKITSDVENGNYISVFRLLTTTNTSKKSGLDDNKRWQILSRCCMAQLMPVLRIGLLRMYNKSFMKEEKVQDANLAALLHVPNPESAVRFCRNVGIPISSSLTTCAVMKAAPICIQDCHDDKDEVIRQLMNPGRDEDLFVFGELLLKSDRKVQRRCIDTNDKKSKKMSSLQKALAKTRIDDQKEKVEKNEEEVIDHNHDQEWAVSGFDNATSRADEDGVMILPSIVLRQLIFL